MARSATNLLKSPRVQTALYYARKKKREKREAARSDPLLDTPPSIDGVAEVGETLTAVAGVWSDDPVLTYAWRRNGVIVGVGDTYELTEADLDAEIWFTETARTATGFSTASSDVVGPVAEGGG